MSAVVDLCVLTLSADIAARTAIGGATRPIDLSHVLIVLTFVPVSCTQACGWQADPDRGLPDQLQCAAPGPAEGPARQGQTPLINSLWSTRSFPVRSFRLSSSSGVMPPVIAAC